MSVFDESSLVNFLNSSLSLDINSKSSTNFIAVYECLRLTLLQSLKNKYSYINKIIKTKDTQTNNVFITHKIFKYNELLFSNAYISNIILSIILVSYENMRKVLIEVISESQMIDLCIKSIKNLTSQKNINNSNFSVYIYSSCYTSLRIILKIIKNNYKKKNNQLINETYKLAIQVYSGIFPILKIYYDNNTCSNISIMTIKILKYIITIVNEYCLCEIHEEAKETLNSNLTAEESKGLKVLSEFKSSIIIANEGLIIKLILEMLFKFNCYSELFHNCLFILENISSALSLEINMSFIIIINFPLLSSCFEAFKNNEKQISKEIKILYFSIILNILENLSLINSEDTFSNANSSNNKINVITYKNRFYEYAIKEINTYYEFYDNRSKKDSNYPLYYSKNLFFELQEIQSKIVFNIIVSNRSFINEFKSSNFFSFLIDQLLSMSDKQLFNKLINNKENNINSMEFKDIITKDTISNWALAIVKLLVECFREEDVCNDYVLALLVNININDFDALLDLLKMILKILKKFEIRSTEISEEVKILSSFFS